MSSYRKPSRFRKGALATAWTIVACLAASFIGLLAYCLATGGWEAIAGFFAGKWFALIVIVVIVAVSLAAWLFLSSMAPGRNGRDRDGK